MSAKKSADPAKKAGLASSKANKVKELKKITRSVPTELTTTVHAVVVMVCVCLLINQTWLCLMRYIKKETATKVSILPASHPDAPFIGLTVCPQYNQGYKRDFLSSQGLPPDTFQDSNFASITKDPSKDIRNVFKGATYELKEMLDSITISTTSITNGTVIIDINDHVNMEYIKVCPKVDNTFGRCYSIEFAKQATSLGISSIQLSTFIGVFIYICPTGQYFHVNSNAKVQSKLGEITFVDLNFNYLVNNYQDSAVLPCDPAVNKNYDDVLMVKVNDLLDQTFGCTVPFLPELPSKRTNGTAVVPICRDQAVADLAFNQYLYSVSVGQNKLVNNPCTGMDVFLGWPFPGPMNERGKAAIKMYLKSTVVTNHSELDYNHVSMLADIGGYTGLLLGVSAVHLSVLVNNFIVRLFNRNTLF